MTQIQLDRYILGDAAPCFVIAEAGVNHNGDIEQAKQLIEVAAAAGVDAVKFQTFKATNLATAVAPMATYQQVNTGRDENQVEMLKRLELSLDALELLQRHARQHDILLLSSPFDEEAADLLEQLEMPAYKIPSGEVINLPFLEHVAEKGRPMIVSTGMANLSEVERAVETIEGVTNPPPLVLLHCVSNYPSAYEETNLNAMHTLKQAFNTLVGYSDHTLGIEIPLAAVAVGACVIEKHFTLDRNLPGPDHRASLEPDELHAMVLGIRRIEAAMGDGRKRPVVAEFATALAARKSIVAGQDIPADTLIEPTMLRMKRPGSGILPSMRDLVIGRTTRQHIPEDTIITWDMLQ